MCGLFSVIPTSPVTAFFAQRLRFLFRCLAKENDSRGGHSWGMWSYDFEPYKGLGNVGDDPQALCLFTDAWKPKRMGWIAGHTRFGTHGGRVVENSHPFTHDRLTLAHNGVVTVNIKDAEVNQHVVDSGQLCIAISKFGIKEALKATTGMIGLLFSDTKTRKFYAYRANQVLSIAKLDWGYVISSDKRHLEDALNFCGFFDYAIESLPENMVSAPWYPDFEPYEVKSGGLSYSKWDSKDYDWQSYGGYRDTGYKAGSSYGKGSTSYGTKPYVPPSTSTPAYTGKQQVYRDGHWQDADSTPTLGFKTEPNVKPLLVKGTGVAEDGASLPDMTALDLDTLDLGTIPSCGKHGALHSFTNKQGIIRDYNESGPCDNCGSGLDTEGGFYFDPEMPDLPLEMCSECLEDMHIQGYQNCRTFSEN